MNITKNISNLIETQFPSIYRENGEELVAFVEAYYEFLEQTDGYSEYMNRDMFNANDIDKTVDDFVIHFKNKYLSEFPYATFADKRFLIKHIKDFYQSKGSAKSVKLLMKMLFGEEADVYYPAKDILKPSDSKWVIPNYIELESSGRSENFVGKMIVGSKSKATANVEGLVRKRSNGKLIDVLYLSNQIKEFVDGDYITDDGILAGAPVLSGSLRDTNIFNGGVNYTVGEMVNLSAVGGSKAFGLVSETIDPVDKVDLNLVDGGYGYTLNSSTDLYISDAKIRTNGDFSSLRVFDEVYQYAFDATSASSLVTYIGDTVSVLNSSNSTLGSGKILSATATTVKIQWEETSAIPTGTIAKVLTTGGNVALSGVTDATVEGFIVGVEGQSAGIYYTNSETLTIVNDDTGEFRVGGLSGEEYSINYIETGTGFVFELGTLTNTKDITYNTDLITDYLSVSLDSSDFGFPPSGSETITTSLADALTFTTDTIGEIETLSGFNPGGGYESDPFAVVVNKFLAPSNISDITINVALDDVFPIRVGDDVMKSDGVGGYTDSIAEVKSVSYPENSVANISLRITSYGIGTIEAGDEVFLFARGGVLPIGSGIVNSSVKTPNTQTLAKNAIIETSVQAATGSIQKIKIIDSGFGYVNGETLTITSANTSSIASIASGTAVALEGGIGAGYWSTTNSHLNSEKKIRDNFYYQEYSYEIQSGLTLDRFSDIVKNTVHVAGTELFGRVINKSVNELNTEVAQSTVELIDLT